MKLGNRRGSEGISIMYEGMTSIGYSEEKRKKRPDRFIDVKIKIVDDERWTRYGTIHTGDHVSYTYFDVPSSGIVLGFKDGKVNDSGCTMDYTVMILLNDEGEVTESGYLDLLNGIEIKKGV